MSGYSHNPYCPKKCDDCDIEFPKGSYCPECNSRDIYVIFPKGHPGREWKIGQIVTHRGREVYWAGIRWRCAPHGRDSAYCIECFPEKGCIHGKRVSKCKDCSSVWKEGPVQVKWQSKSRDAIIHGAKTTPELIDLLGAPVEECRSHLESQFTGGMSWENYGEWHIDHMRPCSSFKLSKKDQLRMCFHHTNLQPMWRKDNERKQASFDEDSFEWEWTGDKWEHTG